MDEISEDIILLITTIIIVVSSGVLFCFSFHKVSFHQKNAIIV